MIIREADLDKDALAITEGARKFAEKMALGRFISDDFITPLSKIVSIDGVKILVAEHKKKPIGGLGVYIGPYIWNQNLLVAEELFWWVDESAPFRTAKLLFEAIMEIIDEKGAIPMFKALENSPNGVRKMYIKHGLIAGETLYTRFN